MYSDMGAQEEDNQSDESKLVVVTSFYPLYEFTKQIAGDRAEVSTLVPAGVEPHDWEPTSFDISRARSADIVVVNGAGFESWSARVGAKVLVDTSEGLELGSETGVNPHIWLDPIFATHQAEKIREALVAADPENSGIYNKNADRFVSELDSLDTQIRSGLAGCEKSDFIAFHDAFVHFAKRYGLHQHSIQGVSPEGEILPQRIEQVIALAKEHELDVVYSEDLIDSRISETIANEIPGGRVLVLSPIEGIDRQEQESGVGYIQKMEQNLANLKEGLDCK
jgi:zinc transport system substrate-binding protein